MEMLLTPLLQMLGVEASITVVIISCAVSWVVPLPLFVIAGYQDKKSHEIDGAILLGIGLLTLGHCILFINIVAALVMVLVLYLTFREKELALIGQADFIMLAHWLFSSFCYDSGSVLMVVESLLFLVCLLVYMKVYRDEEGNKWKRGKMVPMFPPYTVTVGVMAVISSPMAAIAYVWGY